MEGLRTHLSIAPHADSACRPISLQLPLTQGSPHQVRGQLQASCVWLKPIKVNIFLPVNHFILNYVVKKFKNAQLTNELKNATLLPA